MDVTVYVPTRNRRDLLERAVTSVLNQDHADLEIIVVDDCSSDGTLEYLRATAANDQRLRFFSNSRPMGAPSARNLAIMSAKGTFVTGLDDDDYFTHDRIKTFLTAWATFEQEGRPPAALYSQAIALRGHHLIPSKRPVSVAFSDLFVQNEIGNQIFAPRGHYLAAGLFDTEMPAWQDLDLFVRVLKQFGTAYLVDAPTYVYDDNERDDRISLKGSRVKAAVKRLSEKYQQDHADLLPLLRLQMLNGYYQIPPDFGDLCFAFQQKKPRHVARIIKRYLKSFIWA